VTNDLRTQIGSKIYFTSNCHEIGLNYKIEFLIISIQYKLIGDY